MPRYYKPNNSTILYLNSSFNCTKSQSITLSVKTAGSGYTSAPTITITTASGDSGASASATCSLTSGAISSITMTNNGSNYTKLPTITLSGGGNPGVITAYSGLNGGSGYITPPNITVSGGGGGSGFSGTCVLNTQTLNTTTPITIVSGGTGYTTGQSLIFTGGGGSGAVGTITATSGVITAVSITNNGSGYTSAPTVSVSGAGSGANLTANLSGASVASIIINNGGSNYSSAPTFVFTATNGGSGASATPTINQGTAGSLNVSFLKAYNYTWNIPDIVVNDLAKLSAINIISTNFNTSTPYTFRIAGLQYDSRDSYFSDYGNPILSMAQNVNVCSYGSLGGSNFCIILTPQTISQIQISVDDDITTLKSGINASINFVIALEIEEYDPVYTQIGDVYGESASRINF